MNILKRLYFDSINKKIIFIAKIFGIMTAIICILALQMPFHSHRGLIIVLACICLIFIGMSKVLFRVVNIPLIELQHAVKKMSNLDFSSLCEINTQDEFEELADAFNKMAYNLKQALNDVRECNSKIEKEMQNVKDLLEQRKELVDMLSHELKTPIGVIKVYGEGMKGKVQESVKEKYSDIIISAADEMSDLVSSLLDLSALECGAKKLCYSIFDFNDLISTMVGKLLEDVPEKNYQLCCDFPKEECYVEADKKRVEQVISNLLVNAKKYVNKDGKIHISIKDNGTYWKLHLENTGESLNDIASEILCQKYYRVDYNKKEGNGLGLTIVAQILEMHHFTYDITYKNNTFSIEIWIPRII